MAGDDHSKGWLIPHKSFGTAVLNGKAGLFVKAGTKEEPAAHQLVGGVTAYQGKDA